MQESLGVLDEIRLNFSQDGLFVLYISMAFIMYGVALQIKVEHFKNGDMAYSCRPGTCRVLVD